MNKRVLWAVVSPSDCRLREVHATARRSRSALFAGHGQGRKHLVDRKRSSCQGEKNSGNLQLPRREDGRSRATASSWRRQKASSVRLGRASLAASTAIPSPAVQVHDKGRQEAARSSRSTLIFATDRQGRFAASVPPRRSLHRRKVPAPQPVPWRMLSRPAWYAHAPAAARGKPRRKGRVAVRSELPAFVRHRKAVRPPAVIAHRGSAE